MENVYKMSTVSIKQAEVFCSRVGKCFDDKKGHILSQNQPLAVCDKTADALTNLNRKDIYISNSTFHYDGGGCC